MRVLVSALLLSALEVVAVSVSPVASAASMAYAVGDIGPGGGKIFYASVTAFTETGSPCGTECHYLEWAPTSWATNDNKTNPFVANSNYYGGGTGSALGSGYNNTLLLATDNAATGYVTTSTDAPRLVRAYRGGGKSDWFIPSAGEWYLISQSSVFSSGGFTGGDNLHWTSTANNTGPGISLQLHSVTSTSGVGDPGLQPAYRTFPVRPIRAFGNPTVQLPNPIAISASAGTASGSVKINFSAGFGDQVASTQSGSTASGSSVQSLAIDSAGNLIYAGYYNQTNVYIRTRISRYDYSTQSVLIPWGTINVGFESLAIDSQNNVWTIGASGIYKYSRTNGTLGSGSWTETFIANSASNSYFININSAVAPINSSGALCSAGEPCTLAFDGQDNIITGSAKSSLRFWKKSDGYDPTKASLIDGKYLGTWDISVTGNRVAYWASSFLRMVEPATAYDFSNAANTKYGLSNVETASNPTSAIAVDSNGVIFTIQRDVYGVQAYVRDQATDFTRVLNWGGSTKGNAAEFDPYGDLIFGAGGVIQVIPRISAPNQTYTANVYQSDGTTFVKSVSNYVSGTDITGLSGSTTYKVSVTANASTGYTASSSSSLLSATTPTDPPSITFNTISGNPVAGQVLTSNVTASGTVTRVWQRDGVAIASATSGTYSLVAADVGTKISVTATATNSSGNTSNTTSDFGPITALAPAISSASISGTLIKGQTLTATSSGVTGIPTPTSTFTWNRDGTPISGATASTYILTTDDVGKAISAAITVTNVGGSASATSANTSSISKITPTLTLSLPAGGLTGTYGTAVVITATVNTPGSVTFKASGTSISGCTSVVAASTSATCTWTPLSANSLTSLTADFAPTDISNYGDLIAAGSLSINVGKVSLDVTASSHTVEFGGVVPTITPAYSGFVNGDTASVVSGATCSTTYTTTTSLGTTTSNCSGATAGNYSFSYTSGVITITQGGQTSALTINSISVTYGSTLSLTTLGGNGSGANSFMVNSGPCSVSGDLLSASAAGTCMVTATKAANGNYLAASSASTEITVAKKNLTISGLTGVNKVFDGDLASTVTGTPSLVGVVGSDNVALTGTPTFAFATADVANTKPLTGSGYGLTNSTASNYTLTQPVVIANVSQKVVRVIATNVTIASGATVTSSFTTSGLVTGDSVTAVTYSYSGTGTSTPPTAVGVYTITPSLADFGSGSIGNYSITYEAASLTILAKYTTTYNANGGAVSGGSTSNVDFVVGDNALTLPTPTRANYTFTGWYTLQANGTQVTGAYTPAATATLWAHWIQNSLYGMGNNTRIFSLTTIADVGNTYSANAAGGTVGIEYLANALPAGTVIDAYLLSDTSTATTLIGASNTYVMSLVLAWVATDGTVPTTAANKAISMTITNGAIKKGAKIYSVIGTDTTLLGIATVDGSATISITDDPQIIIAITKPDAPTGVSATSGGNAVSTVSWTAPANDGGSSITSYTAVSNSGQSCTTSATSCQVTGLANGTSYTFTVTALNSIGVSDTSTASVAITPSAPAPASVVTPTVVATPTVVSAPVVMITPTLTSLTFVENATKDGGKLVWTGTNIESVLYTGNADAYPAPYNYGAFTISWGGQLANMVAGVTYTMKLEVRSSTGGSASKTIEYTISKPVVDTSAADAALKAAQEKAAAEAKAAEEAAAAALKIAQEKALAEAKAAADAVALKIALEKAAAEAKAAADAAALKIAQEKAAAEAKAAADAALKVAQDKAAADAIAAEEAAALKVAEEKAAADAAALTIAKKTPVLNLFSAFSTAQYTSTQMAKMKKLTLKLEPATTLKCVGYINTKGTTAAKAKSIALAQAKTACANAKKLNPSITTVVTTAAVTKAPKPLVGASNTKAKYRVDLFAYKG